MTDPLKTKPIPNVDPSKYVARRDGKILGVRRGRVLASRPYRNALIVRLTLGDKRPVVKVALLVCKAFHGPCPGPGWKVGYRNEDRTDTSAANLYWRKFEGQGCWQGKYGTDCHSHRMTEQQAIDALERMARGESSTSIGEDFNVNPRTIRFLAAGHTWPHLPRPPGLLHRRVRRMLPRKDAKAA